MPVPDPTPRGIPLIDRSVPVEFHTAYNAQSEALDTALDDLEQDILDRQFAATEEDLPTTDNSLGDIRLTLDDQQLWVCVGLPATWVRTNYLDRASTNPTMGAGWETPSMNNLIRRGGFAYLEFNAFRSTNLAPEGVVVQIPPGYRGTMHRWTEAWATFGPDFESYQIYYNPFEHEIRTRDLIPAGASLAVSMDWPTV
ncbi:hypothetical protein [Agromyces sp. NPDC058064]|uniref:hypothetical protein n=1 Tax=Agromyces sp. NPDC058064 TaxID=3346322 RepID=UPI0036DF2A30